MKASASSTRLAGGCPASMGIQACSRPRPDELILIDGTRLALRPLRADDRDGLAALFARLSPESRRRRFLSPKPRLTQRELAHLTIIDGFHREAVAAVDPRDRSIVGTGRYVRYLDRPSAAEVAFEVADELQGMGIGTALVTRILEHGGANGVALFTATTLWDNHPAGALLRRFKFRPRASHGSVIELELELDSPGHGRPVRVERPRVVMASLLGHEGRKHRRAAAIYVPDRELCEHAEGLWIELRDPATVGAIA